MRDRWRTGNFAAWEFLCPCCKVERMDINFIVRLQRARTVARRSFVIGSGWRCEARNRAVGGVEDSAHLTGHAADIMTVTSEKRFVVLDALLEAGFMRIGIAKFFIHVDDDLAKPQGVIWVY